jgi:hypothetical protein
MLKLITIVLSLTALLSWAQPVQAKSVFADDTNVNSICQGVGLAGGSSTCDKTSAQSSVGNIVKTAINLISLAVGVIAVIMIIIGGLKYITSGGDSAQTSSAKNTILYAIIGLVIVALAQVIVRFVLANVK